MRRASTRRAGVALVATLAVVLAGCAAEGPSSEEQGAEVDPTMSVPAPSTEPAPSAPPEATASSPEPEPWVQAGTTSGSIALSLPPGWRLDEQVDDPDGSLVEVLDEEGVYAMRASYGGGPGEPWCDDQGGWEVVASEPVEPFAAPGAQAIELTTLTRGDDYVLVAMLQAEDVEAGCLPQSTIANDGMHASVTTTYRSGGRGHGWMPDVTAQDFLRSPVYEEILEVMRSVQLHGDRA